MRTRRSATRRERRQQQSPVLAEPFQLVQSPLPPLDWASPDDVEKLHDASMDILEDIGLDFFDDEALDIWEKAGAKVDRAARHAFVSHKS